MNSRTPPATLPLNRQEEGLYGLASMKAVVRSSLSRSLLGLGFSLLSVLGLSAGTLETLEGRKIEGELRLENGGLRIAPAGSPGEFFPLSKVKQAVFTAPTAPVVGHGLRGGWRSQDVGEIGLAGNASQAGETLQVRASGIGIQDPADGFHFVFQPMRGNAEIVARVGRLEAASPTAVAGVMIHHTELVANSSHVAMLCEAGGPVRFQYRLTRKRPNPPVIVPRAAGPVWVKLARQDRVVQGSYSTDGTNWQVTGAQRLDLGPVWGRDDQWLIGVAASGQTNFGLCNADFDQVSVVSHGLLGDYFERDDFKHLVKTRVDAVVDFSWGEASPPGAVRWTGQLCPASSDTYSFFAEPEGHARLWLDGQLTTNVIHLVQGRRYQLKLECSLANAPNLRARLYWTRPARRQEIIPSDQLIPVSDSPASPPMPAPASAPAGLALKSGSFLVGGVVSADTSSLEFRPAGKTEIKVPWHQVARLHFRSLPPPAAGRLRDARPGLITVSGDLVEGEFQGLTDRQIKMGSVLFGIRYFHMDKEAGALVLAELRGPSTGYEVRTHNGSIYRTQTLQIQTNQLAFQESALGPLSLLASELAEIALLANP